jgi:hypothetical protein
MRLVVSALFQPYQLRVVGFGLPHEAASVFFQAAPMLNGCGFYLLMKAIPCGLTIPVTTSVRMPVDGSSSATEVGVAL